MSIRNSTYSSPRLARKQDFQKGFRSQNSSQSPSNRESGGSFLKQFSDQFQRLEISKRDSQKENVDDMLPTFAKASHSVIIQDPKEAQQIRANLSPVPRPSP